MFIEITNKMTRIVNRLRKISELMYVLVNNITLAEINKTVEEKSVPIGSRMIGKLIEEELIENTSHEISQIKLRLDKYSESKNVMRLNEKKEILEISGGFNRIFMDKR